MGLSHMGGVARSHNAVVTAVCDPCPDALAAARKSFMLSEADCSADYQALLKRDDIDAVIVASPDQYHRDQTVDALRAGLPVLCEKPMALTTQECADMLAASDATGSKLMVGQICRYAPGFITAKKMIEDGQIGELFYVESEYAHDYSHISGVGGWRVDPVKLRHPIIGGGIHAVDLLRWIAGDPHELHAYSSRKILTDWPVDDCFISILKFPSGVLGKVFCSVGCKRSYTMRSVFYGSEGTIIAENTLPYIILYKDTIADKKLFEGNYAGVSEQRVEIRVPVRVDSHNTSAEITEFSDIILSDKPVVTDGRSAARSVAVCVAIVESAREGRSVLPDYSAF